MNNFTKTLFATVLLAGAGAANAGIASLSATNSEAFLSVYDSSQALTFTLDLGLTNGDLTLNLANTGFTKSYDLNALTASAFTANGGQNGAPTDARWSTFAANLNPLTTVYGIMVGNSSKMFTTGKNIIPKFVSPTAAASIGNAIKNHANQINTGTGADNPTSTGVASENFSTIVANGDTAATGQHNGLGQFNTIFSTVSLANANIAYGQSGDMWYYDGTKAHTLLANQWKLDGGVLTYGSVSAVPLPAAVWMFGAGLMGVLGLTRRKSVSL